MKIPQGTWISKQVDIGNIKKAVINTAKIDKPINVIIIGNINKNKDYEILYKGEMDWYVDEYHTFEPIKEG